MAFAAVRGGSEVSLAALQAAVPWQAWVLVLGNLFWVLAYDTEYAMVDRDDDLKIGMKTSAITLGRFDVAAILCFYVLYLALTTVVLASLGRAGAVWGLALAAAVVQVVWHARLIWQRSREGCFRAFRENHWLGFGVFLGIALQ
jgi:4-hydroxybenzoate polyprenyltransferase